METKKKRSKKNCIYYECDESDEDNQGYDIPYCSNGYVSAVSTNQHINFNCQGVNCGYFALKQQSNGNKKSICSGNNQDSG